MVWVDIRSSPRSARQRRDHVELQRIVAAALRFLAEIASRWIWPSARRRANVHPPALLTEDDEQFEGCLPTFAMA
jgi:hypothetical protein